MGGSVRLVERRISRCPKCWRPVSSVPAISHAGTHWCRRHQYVYPIPGVIRRREITLVEPKVWMSDRTKETA